MQPSVVYVIFFCFSCFVMPFPWLYTVSPHVASDGVISLSLWYSYRSCNCEKKWNIRELLKSRTLQAAVARFIASSTLLSPFGGSPVLKRLIGEQQNWLFHFFGLLSSDLPYVESVESSQQLHAIFRGEKSTPVKYVQRGTINLRYRPVFIGYSRL